MTSQLLKPMEKIVQRENVVATTNKMKTSHVAQPLFVRTLNAVIRLKIPIKARCGAKLAKGNNAKSIIPEIT